MTLIEEIYQFLTSGGQKDYPKIWRAVKSTIYTEHESVQSVSDDEILALKLPLGVALATFSEFTRHLHVWVQIETELLPKNENGWIAKLYKMRNFVKGCYAYTVVPDGLSITINLDKKSEGAKQESIQFVMEQSHIACDEWIQRVMQLYNTWGTVWFKHQLGYAEYDVKSKCLVKIVTKNEDIKNSNASELIVIAFRMESEV